MWLSFVYALVVGLVIIIVPGYLMLRSMRAPRAWALATAPLISLGLYVSCGEMLSAAAIKASAYGISASILLLAAMLLSLIHI